MELHTSLLSSSGRIWHTVRRADGTWLPFGDVVGVVLGQNPGTPNPGGASLLDSALVQGELQVVAVSADRRRLWHVLRRQDGTWTPFGDAAVAAGGLSRPWYQAVGAGTSQGRLAVGLAAYTTNGQLTTSAARLYTTIRLADGNWTSFAQAGGGHSAVDCTGVNGSIHVCGVTADKSTNDFGRLWHGIRAADGSVPFNDVRQVVLAQNPGSADPGSAGVTSCVAIGEKLHVLENGGGRVWHTVRRADGSWTAFGDVRGVVLGSNPGSADPGTGIASLSCAAIGSALHVVLVNASGRLFHTIRRSDGSWFPFGDVIGAVTGQNPGSQNPGSVMSASAAA